MRTLFIVGTILFIPYVVSAQLVTCGFSTGAECNACNLVSLAQRIISFLIQISTALAVLAFAWAGILMVTSAGNETQVSKAKGIFTNVLIGFIIVLSAWLIVDTVMKVLVKEKIGKFGPWNNIECVVQPQLQNVTIPYRGATASGLSSTVLSDAALSGISLTGDVYRDLCAIAENKGLAGQCSNLSALMAIESSGCKNKVSSAGAYGCMQILPSTARSIDPSLANYTDQQIAERLRTDNKYSMELGVDLYRSLSAKYNGDTNKIYAAYNGGTGANEASNDCPGQAKWQCVWDSPGCYGTSNTNCRRNTGYEETRNYVRNITNLSNSNTVNGSGQ